MHAYATTTPTSHPPHTGASVFTFIAALKPKGFLGEGGSPSDAGFSLGLLCQVHAGDHERGGVEFGPPGHFSW